MEKNNHKFFVKKIQALLFAMKVIDQPHRKAYKLNFQSVVIFSKPTPFTKVKILRAPFLHQAP